MTYGPQSYAGQLGSNAAEGEEYRRNIERVPDYVKPRTCALPNRRHRRSLPESRRSRRTAMLYTIAIVLVVLWLLGLITSYTMGGFLHILLVVAVIMIVVQLIQGRRV